jgi:predicted RNA binding protein YcfA (HicA-like mRNA interferase family)
MSKLPALTAKQIVRALKRVGFVENRQKGSHLVLIHPATGARTVVPMHSGRTIHTPLLRAIIQDARLSSDAFMDLL